MSTTVHLTSQAPKRSLLWPLAALLLVLALAVGLAACGDDDENAGGGSGDIGETLRVGVTPVPHAEILKFVKDNLAQEAGLDIEISEFSDYVLPNTAVADGELDANYFQTPAYLADQTKARKLPLVSVVGVHIEPLGLYSEGVKSVGEIKQGATVAVPNDAANEARALRLLAANDLIGLKDEKAETITPRDVTDNPKKLKFEELEAAQLPRSLQDVDLAVINGNYAIDAGLTPAEDALVLESAEGNPNANLLVTTEENREDPRITKLAELLTSAEVKQFIEDKYAGAVIPAF